MILDEFKLSVCFVSVIARVLRLGEDVRALRLISLNAEGSGASLWPEEIVMISCGRCFKRFFAFLICLCEDFFKTGLDNEGKILFELLRTDFIIKASASRCGRISGKYDFDLALWLKLEVFMDYCYSSISIKRKIQYNEVKIDYYKNSGYTYQGEF